MADEAEMRFGRTRGYMGAEEPRDPLDRQPHSVDVMRSALALDRLLRRRGLRRRRCAARRGVGRDQIAELRMPVAAIVDQKCDHRSHTFHVRTVDDGATIARTTQQPGPHQDGQMRRQGIVRRTDRLRDHAGGDADRLMLHQQPEDREPGRLRQRGEGRNRVGLAEGACPRSPCWRGSPPRAWIFASKRSRVEASSSHPSSPKDW